MVKRVSRSVVVGYNRFNLKHAVPGWVHETKALRDFTYHTSEFIAVTPGDTVYFGAAVIAQGWHMVTYGTDKTSIRRVTLNDGIRVFQSIDEETSILKYKVEEDVHYIRVICDTRYINAFLVTVNRPFTAGEYRQLMASPGTDSTTHMEEQNPDCWTVVLNCQGTGVMTVGEQKVDFSPGTIVCVPPGVPFRKESAVGFSDVHVYADTFLLAEQLGDQWMVTADDNNQSIESLLLLMLRIFWEPAGHYRRLLEQLFSTVEQLLFYRLQAERPHRHQINRMLGIMMSGFTDPEFSLEEVFEGKNYCSHHLRRLFKQEIGCTPLDYLTQLRINHAKKLLGDNAMLPVSVAQIAVMSGFRDPCYFSRVFKKHTGTSPAEYMKQQKNFRT